MKLEKYSKPILRVALSLVFLYFGFQQITSPFEWTGFVPEYALNFGIAAEKIVLANAILELSLGALLLIGLYTRMSALILAVHLSLITFSLGLNDLGARDFGLTFATFVIFLNGADEFCLDKKWKEKIAQNL